MELKNEAIAKQLETTLTNAMITKFKEQGHNLTGKGIQSLKTIVKSDLNGLVIQIVGEEYMGKQDSGLKPGEVKMTDQLLRDLEEWVQRRGMATDMRSAKRIAFNVARNMVRIGMHSTNKRIDMSKRGFISSTLKQESNTINNSLFAMFSTNFDLLVKNFTTERYSKLKLN